MKQKIVLAIIVAATLALASCGKDDTLPETPDGGVKIVTTIAGNSGGGTIDTRATISPDGNGTFATGDKLVLVITGSNAGVPGISSYTIGQTTLLWENFEPMGPETSLTFTGYYPEDASVAIMGSSGTFDLYNASNIGKEDLLVATPVTVGKGDVVNLAFRHVMHRLVVKLTSNVLTAAELSAATVQLSRWLKPQGLVDFTTATAFATGSYVYPDAPKQTGSSCAFILVPQDLAANEYNDQITITAAGREFTYTFPTTLPGNDASMPRRLQGGKTLTLNLAINGAAGRSAKSITRGTGVDDTLTLECTGIEVSER